MQITGRDLGEPLHKIQLVQHLRGAYKKMVILPGLAYGQTKQNLDKTVVSLCSTIISMQLRRKSPNLSLQTVILYQTLYVGSQ